MRPTAQNLFYYKNNPMLIKAVNSIFLEIFERYILNTKKFKIFDINLFLFKSEWCIYLFAFF